MPSISIILPTYHRADLIAETLASVQSQTFTDWECIVVDDGGMDNTQAVVECLGDPRFRYVLHQSVKRSRDENVVAVRQFAVKQAQGDFLAFLDDDDVWMPAYLETVSRPLRLYPSCVLAAAARLFWDGVDILETQRFTTAQMDNPLRAVIRHCILVPSQCIIRRSAFERTPGFRVLGSEDYDLWLQLMPLGESWLINEPLVKYRVHSGSSLLDPHGEKRRRLAHRHREVLHRFLERRDIAFFDRVLALGNLQRKQEQLLEFDLEEGRLPASRLARLARLLQIIPSPLLRNRSLAQQYLHGKTTGQ